MEGQEENEKSFYRKMLYKIISLLPPPFKCTVEEMHYIIGHYTEFYEFYDKVKEKPECLKAVSLIQCVKYAQFFNMTDLERFLTLAYYCPVDEMVRLYGDSKL